MNQFEYALNRLLQFVSTEIKYTKPLNTDSPIENNFGEILFDELNVRLALVKYEIAFCVEMPNVLFDVLFSFIQRAEARATLPQIEPYKVDTFIKGKLELLRQITHRVRVSLEEIKKGMAIS
jgi:hypothetical protein